MQILNKDAPIICADCMSVEIKGNNLFCSEKNRMIYNSKPDWCPHPTWISDYQQLYDINIKNCDDMFLVRTPKVRGKSNVDKK